MDEDRLEKIQCVINNFIAYNKYETTNKHKSWISNLMLYGDLKDGGFNMIDIKDFFFPSKLVGYTITSMASTITGLT